jgi:drug/metabolite transporter (DMT)-like permease
MVGMTDASAQGAPSVVAVPPVADLLTLVVAVAAVSLSAPLIAATAAPVLAVAFWRNAFGAAATGAFMLALRRGELRLDRGELRTVALAGVMLAAHFATWMPSLRYTSVASSTALVATQPVWAAIIARLRGASVARQVWWGIAVSMAGVVLLTGIDVTLDRRSLVGDLLALAGAMFAAAYVTVGASARRTVSTGAYTTYAYAVCSALLLVVCLGAGSALAGYDTSDWWRIVLLTATAQLLGHTLVNRTLRTTSPTVVSLAILFEMPGAAIVAAIWLGQVPPLAVVPAVALILAGLVIVVRSSRQDVPTGEGVV